MPDKHSKKEPHFLGSEGFSSIEFFIVILGFVAFFAVFIPVYSYLSGAGYSIHSSPSEGLAGNILETLRKYPEIT
jgi:hypothetical protein